ncbi:MAG: hypothetical protein HC933_18975 [Pleurocapsa sp. SU_196_0]|nr:hypothetical protein [Pleurocapsa sp. SU_196_0]
MVANAYVNQYGFSYTYTDSQGRYELTVQAAHNAGQLEYNLEAYTPGFEYNQVFALTTAVSGQIPTEVQQDLTLDTARVTLSIRGVVRDGNGSPVIGATVNFEYASATIVGNASVLTDADGRYELRLEAYENVQVFWGVRASFDDLSSASQYGSLVLGTVPPHEYTQDLVIQP